MAQGEQLLINAAATTFQFQAEQLTVQPELAQVPAPFSDTGSQMQPTQGCVGVVMATPPVPEPIVIGSKVLATAAGTFSLHGSADGSGVQFERPVVRARHENFQIPELDILEPAAEGTATFSLPEGLRVSYSHQEPVVASHTKPFVDHGWFSESKALNKFHPEPPDPPRVSDDRSPHYDSSRMRSNWRPPGRAPRFGTRRRPDANSRCPRCGSELSGNRCGACGVSFCELCREPLEDGGKCGNLSCAKREAERCSACGLEFCECTS